MDEISRLYAKKPIVKRSNSSLRIQRKKSSQQLKSPADRILFLQRTIGNQAVQRMVRSGALQAKLRIGQPGDVYEQEADRVADAVMRMPEPRMQRQVEPEEEEEEETLQTKPLAKQIKPLVQVQRQEEPEEEEEILQAKPLAEEITPLVQRQVEPEEEEEEEEMLQAQSREDATSEVPNDLESQINAIRGGQPLAESERAYFEPRFGADFSQVRLHTDSQAAESARAVNARAFTVGQDVVFGAGQYAQGASEGRRLMAHELTHVHQQQSSLNRVIINRWPPETHKDIAINKQKKGERDAKLKDSVLVQGQRMLPCQPTLDASDPVPSGFKAYHGNTCWFHCCYRGILEDRSPSPDVPQNECFYDENSALVDEHHEYPGCRGTPNQFDSESDSLKHSTVDEGGIWRKGLRAFLTSRRHTLDQIPEHKEERMKDCRDICNQQPWYLRQFCKDGCSTTGIKHK